MSTHTTAKTARRALVTGASSGIGAAIARELAALGVDLVLTARRRDALEAVAATCKGVKVEIVTADLGKPDAAIALWDTATASGPIDILINNAGFGYFHRFDEVDWARDAELIQLNMTSLVQLARCFVDAHEASAAPAHMLNLASTERNSWKASSSRSSRASASRTSMTIGRPMICSTRRRPGSAAITRPCPS